MTKLISKKIPVIEYLAIAFGAAIMAIGIGVFLVDAKICPNSCSLNVAPGYFIKPEH